MLKFLAHFAEKNVHSEWLTNTYNGCSLGIVELNGPSTENQAKGLNAHEDAKYLIIRTKHSIEWKPRKPLSEKEQEAKYAPESR